MSIAEILRIFFGGLFVLFVPGFAWSYVFLAKNTIDWVERVALSIGLSITLVPLAVFWINRLFHIKITLLSTSLTVCGLIIMAVVCISVRRTSWGKDAATKMKSFLVRVLPGKH